MIFLSFRCYNCGEFTTHLASECDQSPQPKKCHHCKSEDHLIADCPLRVGQLDEVPYGGDLNENESDKKELAEKELDKQSNKPKSNESVDLKDNETTGEAGSNERKESRAKKLHSREKNSETLPPSVEADEKQNSKEAIEKVSSNSDILGDKLAEKSNSTDRIANKAEHLLNGTTKCLINYKKLSKKIKKRQTSTSSLSNTSFSSSSEISSSSISSKSVSPCSFSYSNQPTGYPFADYYVDNSTQNPTYSANAQASSQFNHFAGNQMAHSQILSSQMLAGQLNGQLMVNQMVNNPPTGAHLLDNQARSNLIAPESNYFPESTNYPYYGQSIESYLPPSSSYSYAMNPSYSSSTTSLPVFRSSPPSAHHTNSLPSFKVCPSPYECNEMFLSNAGHLKSSADSNAEYLNYLNSAYQPNNQLLYSLPSQASPVSPMPHPSSASYNRLTCPSTYPDSFSQPNSIRSDNCTVCGNYNHPSLSSSLSHHQMSHMDHPFSHLEHSSNYTSHPLYPIYHPASQSDLSMSSRSDCTLSQFACEEKLRIGHHICSRNRSQQCTNHRQIDCHLHRGCCGSGSRKACGNICRVDSCISEPFEQNYHVSSCTGCVGHDCRCHVCSHNRISSRQHCNSVYISDRTVCHPNACNRHQLHPAGLDACKARNCRSQCLQSDLITNQLSSSVSDFTGSCANQSTNCEMQEVSAKKTLDQFETDSGIATRCNSTANGSLEIE